MRVPIDLQRALYDRHAEHAVDLLLELLAARRGELVALGRRRAFDEVGVEQYGDSTYFLDLEQLDGEAAAELADAIFYLGVALSRRAGELPPAEPASHT